MAPKPAFFQRAQATSQGFASAANVLAGERYGIPIVGTMAHSFVQVHGDEMTAFENFRARGPTASSC